MRAEQQIDALDERAATADAQHPSWKRLSLGAHDDA
jgi:hypothetical protein